MTAQEIAREREMTQLVNKYKPLIEKITYQQWNNMTQRQKEVFGPDDIRSYALEGFALAINNYDPSRSKMTFMQYAAFSMRNNCLTYINEDSRTIKISLYNQQKLKESGQSTIITTSIENIIPSTDDEVESDRFAFLGFNEHFEDGGNPIDRLVDDIKDNFDEDTCNMFFGFYGLDGHEDEKGIDIAKKYHVSNATVTIRIKKVISYIQKNEDLIYIIINYTNI